MKDGKPPKNRLILHKQYQFLVPDGYTFVSPALVAGEGDLRVRDEFLSISLLGVLFNAEP